VTGGSRVTEAPRDPANYCYRHPNRQSFVLCQRCARTICPQCQTQAAVGVHCPECTKEARQSAPRRKPAVVTALRTSDRPLVTYALVAICVVVYLLQLLPGGAVTNAVVYYPPLTKLEPWRMLTSLFAHSPTSFLHILFNMYSLLILGPLLERMVGRGRFLALYLLSGFAGCVAVLFFAPTTVVLGASGAIFGLLGAFFVIQRRLGGNNLQLMLVIVINLVIGFVIPNIAWQAHVGGLVAGGIVALIYLNTRMASERRRQVMMVSGVAVALILLTVIGWAILSARYGL